MESDSSSTQCPDSRSYVQKVWTVKFKLYIQLWKYTWVSQMILSRGARSAISGALLGRMDCSVSGVAVGFVVNLRSASLAMMRLQRWRQRAVAVAVGRGRPVSWCVRFASVSARCAPLRMTVWWSPSLPIPV